MRERSRPRKRARVDEQRRRSPAYKVLYVLIVLIVAGAWAWSFVSYFRRYDSEHPIIEWATPWHEDDVMDAHGVFLWEETTLAAPVGGKVSYPMGTGPLRVFKGAVVARVASGNTKRDVKSPTAGYFVAGTDGYEGKWRYSSLWLGNEELPDVGAVAMRENGAAVKKGEAIGKIIPQPQELRFICYIDKNEVIAKRLANNSVTVRFDTLDTASRVNVRVWEDYGHRLKAYISLPWFPPSAAKSRASTLLLETAGMSGVTVPESAVTFRGGKLGAYVIDGTNAVFREVTGRAIDGGRFLVTSGVVLGDAVVVDGDRAEEGRVDLW